MILDKRRQLGNLVWLNTCINASWLLFLLQQSVSGCEYVVIATISLYPSRQCLLHVLTCGIPFFLLKNEVCLIIAIDWCSHHRFPIFVLLCCLFFLLIIILTTVSHQYIFFSYSKKWNVCLQVCNPSWWSYSIDDPSMTFSLIFIDVLFYLVYTNPDRQLNHFGWLDMQKYLRCPRLHIF